MFQPVEGCPAIEEADGHDDDAQPDAVEEGLEDLKSSDDFPEEEVKPPVLEEDARSAKAKLLSMTMIYMIVSNILCTRQIIQYRIIGFCLFYWPLGQYHYICLLIAI